jgi:hypothetical protein
MYKALTYISSMSLSDGCAYCGARATTWDHIIPRSKGGPSHVENLAPCCLYCNSLKSSKTLEEFRNLLADMGKSNDFNTPRPFAIKGVLEGGLDGGNLYFEFSSLNGDTILDIHEYHNRIYVNDK